MAGHVEACTGQTGEKPEEGDTGQKYEVIILSDNSHPLFTQTVLHDDRQAHRLPLFVFSVGWDSRILAECIAVFGCRCVYRRCCK